MINEFLNTLGEVTVRYNRTRMARVGAGLNSGGLKKGTKKNLVFRT